jgi:hypothetical protein
LPPRFVGYLKDFSQKLTQENVGRPAERILEVGQKNRISLEPADDLLL